MIKKGILYGVGVGPGDIELITLKAVRVLQEADIIFNVVSRQSERSISANVVDNIGPLNAERIELVFAMTKSREDKDNLIKKNSEIVLHHLQNGKKCAFTTIGDPLTYSTYGYLMKEILRCDPEIECITIPGVNSWSALAAESNTILVEDRERLTIVPSYDNTSSIEALDHSDTTVFLKTYNSRNSIIEELSDCDRDMLYGSNIGMNEQFISNEIKDISQRKSEYLSMLLVKKNGTTVEKEKK